MSDERTAPGATPVPVARTDMLTAALDSMLDPFVVLAAVRDDDGAIVDFVFADANPAACAFNGRTVDELVGTRLLDLHPSAATSGLLDDYRRVVETGEPLVLDDWAYSQDLLEGEKRYYDVRAVRVGDALAQTWRDVTERQVAQAQALASVTERERDYRLLAENAADVVVRSRGGIAVWVSPSMADVLGWSPEELVGTDLTVLVHPDDRPALAEARVLLVPGQSSRLRYRVRARNGVWRWMQVDSRLWVDEDGRVDGTVGTLRLVDDDVAAIEALEASQQRLRGVIDALVDPWVLLESVRDRRGAIVDFRFVDANEAACASNGVPYEELIGSHITRLLPGLVESGMLAEYARVVETGAPMVLDGVPFRDPVTGVKGHYDNRAVRVDDGLSLTWRDVSDRHSVAAALADSEARFRLLAENASDVVVELHGDGEISWVSPSVARVLGFDPAELVGTWAWELVHPDDLDLAVGALEEAQSSHVQVALELRLSTAHGVPRWMAVTGRTVPGEVGPVRTIVGLRDIDDLVRVRESEAAERERLQATLDSLLDPHALLAAVRDGAGHVVDFVFADANPAACDYLARSRSELVGSRLLDVLPGQTASGMFQLYVEAVETGLPLIRDEYPYDHEIHGHRRFDIRAIRVGDALSFTWRDVTDRHAAAQRLAAAEQRYRLLAENASEVVLLTGVDGRLEWASPSVERVLGWTPEDVLGSRLSDLLDPTQVETLRQSRRAMLAQGASRGRVELRMRCADGSWRWMSDLGSAVLDESGTLVGGVDALRDIQSEVDARLALEESEARFRLAMQNSAVGMCLVHPDGSFFVVNPALCEILGRDEADLLGCAWQQLTHPDDLAVDLGLVADVLAGQRDSYRLLKRYLKPDGTVVWGDLSVSCIRTGHGSVRYFVSQIADVTETIAAREELARSEADYRLLAENASDVVFRAAEDGVLEWLSPSVTSLTGWSPEAFEGRPFAEFLHPDDRPAIHRAHDRLRTGRPTTCEVRVRCLDGTHRWVSVAARPITDAAGQVRGITGGWRDAQAEHEARAELVRSEEMMRTAMSSAPSGVAVVALDRGFVRVNPALCELLGQSEEWLLRHGVGTLLAPEDDETDRELRSVLLSGDATSQRWEHRMVRADGSTVWVDHSIGLVRDADGEPVSFVSQFVDVTDAWLARQQLHYLATHDALTALVNRGELVSTIGRLLGRRPRTGDRLGVLFVDLDGLKPVNDTYGHVVGDGVIREVADRIRSRVRADDVVARYGGDEFVVVLPAVHDVGDAASIADKIQQEAAKPLRIGEHVLSVTLSIGVAVAEPGDDPETTLRRADAALYRAKAAGRARTVVHDPRLDDVR